MGGGRSGGGGKNRATGDLGGMGTSGDCICPKCGFQAAHLPGVPCREQRCPKCNAVMVRQGSYHHNLIEEHKATRKAKKDQAEQEQQQEKKTDE